MTPELIEAAARELCRIRELDADVDSMEALRAEVIAFAEVGQAIASVMPLPKRSSGKATTQKT